MTATKRRGRPVVPHDTGARVQLAIGPRMRSEHDFEGGLYRSACPTCGAVPMCWCVTPQGRRTGRPHALRTGRLAESGENEETSQEPSEP